MEHESAIETQAAERYIIGEMDDAEATAFEAHLFDCRICAQDVRDTAMFADSARTAFLEQKGEEADPRKNSVEPLPWYRRPQFVLPYAAMLLMGVTLAYQQFGPGQSAATDPQVFEPVFMRVVRAAPPVVEVQPGQETFLIAIDVPAPADFPRYSMIFRSAEGEVVASVETHPPDAGTLLVLLPSGRFPDGDYTLALRGVGLDEGEGEALEEFKFRVSHQESAK